MYDCYQDLNIHGQCRLLQGWVYGSLQTYLEKNQGFKLGLHQRDFEAGKYIADNIIDAINTSKKIILLL
jgi:hypothetical protein